MRSSNEVQALRLPLERIPCTQHKCCMNTALTDSQLPQIGIITVYGQHLWGGKESYAQFWTLLTKILVQ